MLTINVLEFTGFSKAMFLEYLRLERGKEFKIVMGRGAVANCETKFCVFLEYHFAGYAGDLLEKF